MKPTSIRILEIGASFRGLSRSGGGFAAIGSFDSESYSRVGRHLPSQHGENRFARPARNFRAAFAS